MTYDPKREAHEFIAGTRSEAVADACAFFGAEESELIIRDLGPGDVFGVAGRAVIVAIPSRHGRRQRPGEPAERPARPRERPALRPEQPVRRAEEKPAEPEEESIGTATTELGAIGGFVRGVIERMGLGPFEIAENPEADVIVIAVSGRAARELRGGEGRAAEGIQLLANQVAIREGQKEKRVVLDVEGDPVQREGFLSKIAERAAKRAVESGRAVALEPMNARDRRIIHVSLRDAEDVATMSIGEGRYRQVVVVPKGAPEYEEARQQSDPTARE